MPFELFASWVWPVSCLDEHGDVIMILDFDTLSRAAALIYSAGSKEISACFSYLNFVRWLCGLPKASAASIPSIRCSIFVSAGDEWLYVFNMCQKA